MKLTARRRTGFALIAVLGLTTVLVLLLGALIGTNQTAFGMLRYSQAKDRIDRTVSTVYSYCRFRLEHDYGWARGDFPARGPVEWGQLKVRQLPGGGEVKTLVGQDLSNATRFEVRICNNLREDGEVAVLKDVRTEARLDGVPSGFCRLEIKVEGGGHVEGVEVMVRNPGLVGAVCLANDSMEISASQLGLFTKDPVKNQARSLGQTTLSGMENFFEGSNFDPGPVLRNGLTDGFVSRDNPVVWSGAETEFALNGDAPTSRDAFKASHASLDFKDQRFVDDSKSLFDIPDVGLPDLQQVTHADGSAKTVQSVPSGVYRFEQVGVQGRNVRVLTRRATPAEGASQTSGTIEKFWYMDESRDENVAPDVLATILGAPPGTGQLAEQTKYVPINGAGGRAFADVQSRRMVFDENYNFEVDGDFALVGSSTEGDDNARNVNPSVYFGDPHAIAETGNWGVGAAATTTNETSASNPMQAQEAREKGSLVSSGKLHIQGDVNGSTTLAAKGDVTLEMSRLYDPLGNSENNFSVFSEGSVSLLPPPIIEIADDREVNEETGMVSEVVKGYAGNGDEIGVLNISENTLRFTGLIYAGKDVHIDLQDTRTDEAHRNLFLEGAIVAKRGKLTVTNADQLRWVYNPQFVDRLLPGLSRGRQRRIEVTGWRDTHPAPF